MARGGKESVLSISIKAFGTPEYGGVIKAGSFYPKPKVDSAIIAIRNIHESLLDLGIVKKGFAHKRKLLINNLGVSKGIFDRLGIPEKARAEDLSFDDWLHLTKELT